MQEYVSRCEPRSRPWGWAGETLFGAAMIALLFYKFHALNEAISARYALTAATLCGGLGVLLCLTAPLLALPGRLRGAALVAADILLSLLVLADVLYLRYYSDLFSLRNLGLSSQAGEVADSIRALAKWKDARYFLDAPLFAFAAGRLTRLRAWPRMSWRRGAALCVLFATGAGGVAWKVSDYDRAVRGALATLWDRPSVATGAGALIYHYADAEGIAREALAKEAFAAGDEREVHAWLSERNGNAQGAAYGVAAGKNLIVIQVESLQAFILGLRVGGVEVAPNIGRLAGESLRFPRMYNQTASGNSSDAEFMVNTSFFPTAKGVAYVRFAGNSFRSLAWLLRERGYAAVALHGDRPGFWNRGRMYPALGFERFVSKNEFAPGENIGLGMSDRSFLEQSLGVLTGLRDEGRPFYALLVTLTSHHPFNFGALKEQVTDLPLGTLEDTLLGDYLRAVRYTDREIGRFLEGLARENLLEESVVVLYGDHPAIPRGGARALGDLLGRDLSSAAAWRQIQSIPLMIRLPGGARAGEIDAPAGQMDVGPTVASLMGFPMPDAFGRDLTSPAGASDDLVIFRNGSYVKGTTWVQPQRGQARDLRSLEPVSCDEGIRAATEEAAMRLRYSDRILENDLLKNKILRGESAPGGSDRLKR